MNRPGPAAPDQRSPGEVALGSLIDDSAGALPEGMPRLIRDKAALVGLEGATVLLVDKRQLVLTPFGDEDDEPVEIDTTAPGRCFRESMVVVEEGDRGSGAAARFWFPVTNGASRLGVLGAHGDPDDELLPVRGRQLAGLCAELLAAKSEYGDRILCVARREELSLAAEIRWALVPPLSFLSPEISIAGFLEPAYDIAGDTFDYAINGGTAHVAIIDAVGHGMEASRIANLALLAYRHARRMGAGLEEMYRAIDSAIRTGFEASGYATAHLATLDLSTGVLQWVNAGHPPPLLVRNGDARELLGQPDMPAGVGDQASEIHQTTLQAGDVVGFYSDGITEARSADGTMFGAEHLASRLVESVGRSDSLPEIVRRTVHEVVDHQGGHVLDDATLLLLRWRHSPDPSTPES